eukprot:scaffold1288_cov286-Chaetoceros_neogracile.AAC.6
MVVPSYKKSVLIVTFVTLVCSQFYFGSNFLIPTRTKDYFHENGLTATGLHHIRNINDTDFASAVNGTRIHVGSAASLGPDVGGDDSSETGEKKHIENDGRGDASAPEGGEVTKNDSLPISTSIGDENYDSTEMDTDNADIIVTKEQDLLIAGVTPFKINADTICFPWTSDDSSPNSTFPSDKWWEMHPDYEVTIEQEDKFCFAPMDDKAKATFFRKLHANQYNTTNCAEVYTKRMKSSGWAADFGHVASGLIYGLDTNRVFHIIQDSDYWHYAAEKKERRGDEPPVCPSGDMFCYFLPIASADCKSTPVDNFTTRAVGPLIPWATEFGTRQQQWLRRQVYDYLEQRAPKIETPCAALHVRRADVVLHGKFSRKYFPISEYLDLLQVHSSSESRQGRGSNEGGKALNWTNIILFTDDQNAVEEAETHHPQYVWKHLNKTRHRGSSGGWENQIPSGSPKDEVIAILAILQIAQKCDVLVHSQSGFADVIYNAMVKSERNVTRLKIDNSYVGRLNANNSQTEVELMGRLRAAHDDLSIVSGNSNTTLDKEDIVISRV